MRKIANFRELGGIRCADGRRIRHGRLFRGGKLVDLSEKAEKSLLAAGINRVIDLRSPSELAEYPETVPEGIEYRSIPMLNDQENPSINRQNRRAIFTEIQHKEGGAIGHLQGIYRIMVTSDMAINSLREIFSVLLDPEAKGVFWHCTQGKDRTGITAAVILMALGADRSEIMRDYMKSNNYYRLKNTLIFIGVLIVTFSVSSAKALHRLLSSRIEYMNAAFEEIDKRWGGTEAFLHDAIGLRDSDIAALRNTYLE